jgi:hypothetical protein
LGTQDERGPLETKESAFVASEASVDSLTTTIALENGNVLEFYDLGRVALVSEYGKAYTAPAFQPDIEKPQKLTEIWNKFSRGAPPPDKLLALEARLAEQSNTEPAAEPKSNFRPETGASGVELFASGPQRVQVGCNNGCCDYDWLYNTFTQCSVGDWFLYNYGHTWADFNNIYNLYSMVCSAEGTSTWYVHIQGSTPKTWSIAQGYYRTYSWSATFGFFGFNKKDFDSDVNSSSNMHLHTYCGDVAQ